MPAKCTLNSTHSKVGVYQYKRKSLSILVHTQMWMDTSTYARYIQIIERKKMKYFISLIRGHVRTYLINIQYKSLNNKHQIQQYAFSNDAIFVKSKIIELSPSRLIKYWVARLEDFS